MRLTKAAMNPALTESSGAVAGMGKKSVAAEDLEVVVSVKSVAVAAAAAPAAEHLQQNVCEHHGWPDMHIFRRCCAKGILEGEARVVTARWLQAVGKRQQRSHC